MGSLYYSSSSTEFDFDDRVLAHLEVVITNKLRRGESFVFTWDGERDDGHESIWLHPSIPLRFSFGCPDRPELSRSWLEALAATANSGGGLRLVPEHD